MRPAPAEAVAHDLEARADCVGRRSVADPDVIPMPTLAKVGYGAGTVEATW